MNIDGIEYKEVGENDVLLFNGKVYIKVGASKPKKNYNGFIKGLAKVGEGTVNAGKGMGALLGKAADNYQKQQEAESKKK